MLSLVEHTHRVAIDQFLEGDELAAFEEFDAALRNDCLPFVASVVETVFGHPEELSKDVLPAILQRH